MNGPRVHKNLNKIYRTANKREKEMPGGRDQFSCELNRDHLSRWSRSVTNPDLNSIFGCPHLARYGSKSILNGHNVNGHSLVDLYSLSI